MLDFLQGCREIHYYSLSSSGLKKDIYFEYPDREKALRKLYKIARLNHLQVVGEYDDKHDKTYICECGIKFYVNRIN